MKTFPAVKYLYLYVRRIHFAFLVAQLVAYWVHSLHICRIAPQWQVCSVFALD